MTVLEWVTEAMQEIGAYGAADPLSAEDGALGLTIINRIFDSMNVDLVDQWAYNFEVFTLIANPPNDYLTIGVAANTPDFTVSTARPQKIYGANLVLSNTGPYPVNTTIRIVDHQWWLAQDIQTLATQIPTDLYYQPDWPNGKLYFWPVPTYAYDVQLMLPVTLAQVTLATTISLPPGYHEAVVKTLAEQLLNPMKIIDGTVRASVPIQARHARAKIAAANDFTPRLATRDYGMPNQQETGTRTSFNYRSRSWN